MGRTLDYRYIDNGARMKILCIYCEYCKKLSEDRAKCLYYDTEKSIETLWNYRECEKWTYNKTDVFRRKEVIKNG